MTTYEAEYVYSYIQSSPFEMCKKTYIECSVWCVVSTRTRPRNLITTIPSPSQTELRCLNCTCLWLHDRRANHLLGPPVIDAKAGAVSRSFRYTLSLPHEVDGHAAVDSINCGSRSNIIVRLLEEAKSQVQTERGSCERSCGAVPWSTSQALAWDKIAIV